MCRSHAIKEPVGAKLCYVKSFEGIIALSVWPRGARRSHGQTISADISLFSLPYQVSLYTQWNLKPKLVVLVFSSSQILQFTVRRTLPLSTNMPRVTWRLFHSSVPLRYLNILLRKYFRSDAKFTVCWPLPAGFRKYADTRFRRNEKKLSSLVRIGSLNKLIYLLYLLVTIRGWFMLSSVKWWKIIPLIWIEPFFLNALAFFLPFVPVSKYWTFTHHTHDLVASITMNPTSTLSEVLVNFKLSTIMISDFQFTIVKVLRHSFYCRCHAITNYTGKVPLTSMPILAETCHCYNVKQSLKILLPHALKSPDCRFFCVFLNWVSLYRSRHSEQAFECWHV